jgi:cell division protease FtsH
MKEILAGIAAAAIIFLAIMGVNVIPIAFILLMLGGLYVFMQNQGKIQFQKKGGKSQVPISFDSIGGQDSAIKELKEALEFVLRADEIGSMGIRPLKGVLLVGPPGTGKTLLARAAASYTNSVFIAASGSEFIEMYAGVGAKRVRQLFNEARSRGKNQHTSAIIFIDELEILGAKRGSTTSHMEYDQTLNQLLVEMDGINPDEETRILLIGATNRSDMLDPALLRPGRFDRQVQVALPDKTGRKKILEIHTVNKPLAENTDLDDIARATFGFSGAHLESLTNEAAILAMRENSPIVERRHFTEAIDKVIMGEKLNRRPSQHELERISVHESGHALVSELLESGSVSSLTIISRGKALGFMRKSPQDDQYLYTRGEIEKQIKVCLAGAISEDICLGMRSTGARNDFNEAWKLAREIVENGLSSLGVVGTDIPAEILYRECKSIVEQIEKETRTLLERNRDTIWSIARSLLQEESMDRDRFMFYFRNSGQVVA